MTKEAASKARLLGNPEPAAKTPGLPLPEGYSAEPYDPEAFREDEEYSNEEYADDEYDSGEYADDEYESDEYEDEYPVPAPARPPGAGTELEGNVSDYYDGVHAGSADHTGGAGSHGVELEGFESTPVSDMAYQEFAPSGEEGTYGRGELDMRRPEAIVGSPPLRVTPRLPNTLRSPSASGGLFSMIRYGVTAPKLAQRQRDLVQALGTQVAKLKRDEQDILVALGRAARVHHLAPDSCNELIEATAHQEERAKKEHLRTFEKEEQKEAAELAYASSMDKGEGQLEGLESQRAGLLSRYEGAKKRLDDALANVEALSKREQVLRKPPGRRLSEEDVAKRVQEFEAVKAQRKIAEMDIDMLRDQVRAAERPMERIDTEISEVRHELEDAESRLSSAEDVAKAAHVSVERRQETARHRLKELYEEVGRNVISSTYRPPELRQLVASVNDAERRVDQWDDVLREQQEELDQYDEKRARVGFWILIGAVFGGFVLLLSGGEIFRRIVGG